jgi:biotin carboxyl carrier protein
VTPLRAAVAAGVLALGAGLWVLASEASVELHPGVVTAPVVTLRAPAEGVLRLEAGAEVAAGARVASVEPPARDPAPLAAAEARLVRLRAELVGVEVASRVLADAREAFAARAEAETAARLRIAEARLAEAAAALEAAEGRRREAEAALARAAQLAGQGVGTEADLARIRVALEIAGQEAEAARLRVGLLAAERDAVQGGLLPADPSARMPEAERAARDLALRSGELAARAARLRAAIAAAEAAREAEASRRAEPVAVVSPVAGRVVERLEADGAPVARGAALLRVAECRAAVVTVAPPAPLRAGLAPGQAVWVRVAGGRLLEGEVVFPPGGGAEIGVRVAALSGCPLGQPAEVAFGARPLDWLRR